VGGVGDVGWKRGSGRCRVESWMVSEDGVFVSVAALRLGMEANGWIDEWKRSLMTGT
jgi:hypothetical protein